MKKLALISTVALALGIIQSTTVNADPMMEMYFSGTNSELTEQEKKAIAMSEKWKSASRASLQPAIGANGAINFIFGSGHLSIVCAVLQVCDIELEPGESVNGVNLGDRVRWQLEPAISGSGETQTQHLQIKPMDIGLKTTLVVTTSRRTYHMELRSHKTEYMPYVQFTYPENTIAKWEKFKKETEQAKQLATIPDTKTYLGDLDFNYEISGNASWKPLRVYNDGVKTIIQMPKKWQQNEAPTLLVIRENPGLFASDDEVLVNYRVQEDKYIVDDVFQEAVLIAGVGKNQTRVSISKIDSATIPKRNKL